MNRAYLASGPLVWIVTLAVTTLLLVASAKALVLVVPLLLAVVLYYLLVPVVRALELRGVGRETAAAIVGGGAMLLLVGVLVPSVPWLLGQSVDEHAMGRYLEGGRVLIDRTLDGLESQFGFLQRINFKTEVGARLESFGDTGLRTMLGQWLTSAAMQLPALLLAPFIAFFLLRDGGRFVHALVSVVPNAFFERTVYMFDRVHQTARNYFQGLIKQTAVDIVLYLAGLWLIGVSGAPVLAVVAALMSWIPVVGTAAACVVIVLAAAAQFPGDPSIVYGAVGMFLLVRLLDTFVIVPLTIGRSTGIHPLPTVLMLFIGGTVAGVAGLVLALPLAAVVSTIVGTIGAILGEPRLRARHRHARALASRRINADLGT